MSDHDEALEALDEAENDFDPKKYAIVDPEVRAYVYSLCSAVSTWSVNSLHKILTPGSLEARAPTTMDDTSSETMLWPSSRISGNGSNSTIRRQTASMSHDALQRQISSRGIYWKYWLPGLRSRKRIV